ncbi:MAG: DUF222 domain-containing protein [Egicoccus sp.]
MSELEAEFTALLDEFERPAGRGAVLAADGGAGYDAGPADGDGEAAGAGHDGVPAPDGPDPRPVGDLRAAVATAKEALDQVRRIAAAREVSGGGELAALTELVSTLDRGHSAALELVDRIECEGLAERRAGLPLESLLAMQTNATYGDRRFLTGARDVLRHLPNVRAAFDAEVLGWGQVRAIVSEARPLTMALREELDGRFADTDELRRLQPDEVVDRVSTAASGMREDLQRRRTVARQERRYLHVRESFEGGVRGNFDLPAEEGALLLEALQAATSAPTGDRDVTADAPDPTDPDHAEQTDPADPADPTEPTEPTDPATSDVGGADVAAGEPAEDRFDRPRARQLADGLVRLAEAFLGGQRGDGPTVRARPTMVVVADVADLVGDTEQARRARLLWRLPGSPPALTREAVQRISCDADLQVLLVDGHQVLGITAPTAEIPARVRRAVMARDQGCRFPGCRAPAGWTDLHHVIPRNRGGPTTVDNLVGVCRRHHMAVTEGRWKLSMTPAGTVTVRRGRHTSTSDPPLRRHPMDGSSPTPGL